MKRRRFLAGLGALGAAPVISAAQTTLPLPARLAAATREPDVIFVPTPNDVVAKMLEMAQVTAKDTVYDLGCGDGRIVISAAQKYGARGVGVDIDPQRIAEARESAQKAGVAERVRFVLGDLFETDISPATVVTLYLLTELNIKLKPKLLAELSPGTRVVSHAFAMGDWKPERTAEVSGNRVYLWRVPPRAG
jgi:SAM-dependent methyltransferase